MPDLLANKQPPTELFRDVFDLIDREVDQISEEDVQSRLQSVLESSTPSPRRSPLSPLQEPTGASANMRAASEGGESSRLGRSGSDPGSNPLVESLSRREIEVLKGMAAMLPTEEIAAQLYVSTNTVKTHVRSILRKLSASRRNEAVRRAQSLGIL
jgi:DNA-binding NarL/FixJ family response regulator